MKPLPPFPQRTPLEKAAPALRVGGVLAITISWSLNKSILWALVHGICSWFYVLYYAIFL